MTYWDTRLAVFDLETTRQRQVSTNRTYLNFRISLELKL